MIFGELVTIYGALLHTSKPAAHHDIHQTRNKKHVTKLTLNPALGVGREAAEALPSSASDTFAAAAAAAATAVWLLGPLPMGRLGSCGVSVCAEAGSREGALMPSVCCCIPGSRPASNDGGCAGHITELLVVAADGKRGGSLPWVAPLLSAELLGGCSSCCCCGCCASCCCSPSRCCCCCCCSCSCCFFLFFRRYGAGTPSSSDSLSPTHARMKVSSRHLR